MWLGRSSYVNFAVAPQTDRRQHDVTWVRLLVGFCISRKKRWICPQSIKPTYLIDKNVSPLCVQMSYWNISSEHDSAWCDWTFLLILTLESHCMHVYMCMCVCVGESDLVGLHPAGGLLYDIKLDEGESSALTWTPPSAMVTEQQQQHNNNAVRG